MAKSFNQLRQAMSPQAQQSAQDLTEQHIRAMPLHELRQARGLSQQDLAQKLHVKQPAIAKIEKRTDMYVSTLRSHIEAMGGKLEIVAKFDDGDVQIQQFSHL